MLLFAQDVAAPPLAALPGWLWAVVGLLIALAGIVVPLFMARKSKQTGIRRCAGCGVRLRPEEAGALCSRCISVLSASQLDSAPADGPVMASLGPQTAQGIRAAVPPPRAIASADATPTAAHAGPLPLPEQPELAARFPNLEILELLGKGGMGAVYKARPTKLDRLVALKVLPAEFNRDPTFAERFLREARALARLAHPNIVAVHDFGEADGQPYFVMEFVAGANLRHVIRGGALGADQTLAVVTQVCEALQFAHDDGIIHRDIKPENILLDTKGRVKIADFGLAKLLGPERVDHTLTATHMAMGTMNYMAPEQLDNAARVDHRADIYSLGVVFYEMLTGQVPRGKFDPPSRKAQVDAQLDAVVLRALESDPDRRYQRVSEMQTAVAALTQTGEVALAKAAGLTTPYLESNLGTPSFQSAFRKIGLNLDVEAIKRHVEAPAILLFVTGILTVLFALVGMVNCLLPSHEPEAPARVFVWLAIVANILSLPIGFLTILGSRTMLDLHWFNLARLGCILALIPLSPVALLGFPVGIWGLMVLLHPKVRPVFRTDFEPAPAPIIPMAVEQILKGPRRFLVAASFLVFAAAFAWVGGGIVFYRGAQDNFGMWAGALAMEILGVLNALTMIVMIVAARNMATCRAHALASLGCKWALWPLSPAFLVTLPIGRWALRVLKKPRVREAFGMPVSQAEWQEDAETSASADAAPWPKSFRIALFLFVSAFFGFMFGWLGGMAYHRGQGVDWYITMRDNGLPGMLGGLVAGPLLFGIYREARKILARPANNLDDTSGTGPADSQKKRI